MRVGLNLTFLTEDSGGSATYARGLVEGLPRVAPGMELTVWVGRDAPAPDWLAGAEVIRLPVVGVGGVAHYAWDLGAMVVQARRRRLDVLHGLAYLAPPVHPGLPVVVTILDTIWKRYPATMNWKGRAVFASMSPVLGRSADRVIAISEAGKADLVADLGLPASNIDVTPLAVTPPPPPPTGERIEELRMRLKLGAHPLLLCVAQKRSHKNLESLIDAMAHVSAPARLVLPGSPNAYEQALRKRAAARGVQDRVTFAGWVSDEDLEALYSAATAFVTASLMEGFGLPVLEAMVRGLPVACSNVSALPEVAGHAALTFDPLDPAAIGAALQKLLIDAELRRRLVAAGHARAAAFSWDATALATLDVYEHVLAARRR